MMPGLKSFLIIFCLCLIPVLSNAQDLPTLSKTDSSNILISIGTERLKTSPEDAEVILKQAYAMATECHNPQGKARALFLLARIQKDNNRMKDALASYLEAATLFETLKDSSTAGRCYNHIASIYIYTLNNYARGYQYCAKAIHLLENDSVYRPSALSNMASLHVQTRKFDEALTIYRESYDEERKNNNLRGMCLALNNMATVYDYKKEYKQSSSHYEQALNIAQKLDDNKTISHILIGMSPVQCQMGNHGRAAALAEQALAIARKFGFVSTQISALSLLGHEACHNHKLDQAKKYMHEAERLANQHSLHVFKREIYDILSTLFHKSGNEKEALRYRTLLTHVIDSMAHQERLAVHDIASEKSKTAPVLVATNAAFPMKAGTMAVGVVLVLAGIGFVFYKTSRDRKHIDLLSSTEFDTAGGQKQSDDVKFSDGDVRHLEVFHGQGVKLVALRDIWWFQKDGKLYQAVTSDGHYRVRQNITELEELLRNTNFFRINRSVVINMAQMNNYSFWENHKYILRMKDPARTEFVISRNRLREMKETFQVMEGTR